MHDNDVVELDIDAPLPLPAPRPAKPRTKPAIASQCHYPLVARPELTGHHPAVRVLGLGKLVGLPLRSSASVNVAVLPGGGFFEVARLLVEGHGVLIRRPLLAKEAQRLVAVLRREDNAMPNELAAWQTRGLLLLALGPDPTGHNVQVMIEGALAAALAEHLAVRSRECTYAAGAA